MKRKKLAVWGLLTAMAVSMLTGCAKKPVTGEQDDTNKENQTENTPGEGDTQEPDKDAADAPDISGHLVIWAGDTYLDVYQKIADDFTEATGVTTELVSYTGLTATDKLALDGPAGNGGDVYVNGGGNGLATGVDQGLFMNLDDAGIDTSLFVDGTLADFKYQGSLYGIPTGAESPALIYNKDLISEIPDTWEELMKACMELTDVENDQYGFMMDVTNPYFANALYDANGGYIFGVTEEGYNIEDIGLNSDGTKAVVKEFVNYFDSGLLQKNMTFDVMEKKFTEGKVAVIYDGPWAVAGYKEAGLNIGIAPLPKMENGNVPRVFSGSYGLVVSEFSENKEAAVEFLKFAMQDEYVMDYCRATNRIPAMKSCLELDEVKNDPVQNAFAEQLVNSIPQPNVPEMALIYDPMISALQLITSQGEDVDATLDKAVEQVKEQIAIMHQ